MAVASLGKKFLEVFESVYTGMLHRLVFQKRARQQFQVICDYLVSEFGISTTENFVDEAEQIIAMLMKFPLSGHPEPIESKYVYRSRIVGKYSKMYYYVRRNTLVIAAFVDMRMNPENIKKAVIG